MSLGGMFSGLQTYQLSRISRDSPGILYFVPESRSYNFLSCILDMHDLLNFNYLILLNRIIKVSCNYSYGTSCSHSLKGD